MDVSGFPDERSRLRTAKPWSWHPDAGVKFAGRQSRRRWWL